MRVITSSIALCSALNKAVDILIIERHERILFTSGMQFQYKRYHSTNMCTIMTKEVPSHCNSRHTDVFLCTLDASKAFDRAHLGKLFALLHIRGIPPVAKTFITWYVHAPTHVYHMEWGQIRVLCRKWCKARGHFNPSPFCVYIDKLLNCHLSSGIGCHMRHLSYACFGYADDVNFLAPSVCALQDLITICKNFDKWYNVIFNERKGFACVSGEKCGTA